MPISEKTKQQILAAQEELQAAYAALQAVLDGTCTLASASRSLGAPSPQIFQHTLEQALRPYVKARLVPVKELAKALKALRDPSDRLMLMIFDKETSDKAGPVALLPDYDEGALWSAARDVLTDRKLQAIELCTGHGRNAPATLEEAALEMGCTPNNVAILRDSALRRLRRADVVALIFPGMDVKDSKAVEEARKASARAEIEKARAGLEKKSGIWPPVRRASGPEADAMSIYSVGLSNRTANALGRAGYDTLYQVAARTRTELRMTRNLGAASLEEIARAVKDRLGVDLEP